MKAITIVKVGGNIIDDPQQLQAFLQDFRSLEGYRILVHGGGKLATTIGARMGIASRYTDGRRITDEAMIELVTMVYGGLINKRIVAQLQSLACDAMGLSGADGNSITAIRRPVGDIDFGFVGDIIPGGVNVDLIVRLIESGITPVFAPLTHDGAGTLLNTNADTIARDLAVSLCTFAETRLIYCFEKHGVLRIRGDEQSVIPSLDSTAFEELQAAGIIAEGMVPKLVNAFAARAGRVQRVIIGHASDLNFLVKNEKGTQIL